MRQGVARTPETRCVHVHPFFGLRCKRPVMGLSSWCHFHASHPHVNGNDLLVRGERLRLIMAKRAARYAFKGHLATVYDELREAEHPTDLTEELTLLRTLLVALHRKIVAASKAEGEDISETGIAALTLMVSEVRATAECMSRIEKNLDSKVPLEFVQTLLAASAMVVTRYLPEDLALAARDEILQLMTPAEGHRGKFLLPTQDEKLEARAAVPAPDGQHKSPAAYRDELQELEAELTDAGVDVENDPEILSAREQVREAVADCEKKREDRFADSRARYAAKREARLLTPKLPPLIETVEAAITEATKPVDQLIDQPTTEATTSAE